MGTSKFLIPVPLFDLKFLTRLRGLHWRNFTRRLVRVGVFGLVALTAAVITTDSAEARRYYRHHVNHTRHEDSGDSYSPQFSSIIVDGNSGTMLTATNPDGLRHPASLTKIMTLYLLFERLESGKMKLDTEMPVSEHAADQDPTKLDLRPGSTIKVEDAIKGLVTRSANDAAVVIAEAIGGSEDEFAKMMTRKARALGMSRTVYRNASAFPTTSRSRRRAISRRSAAPSRTASRATIATSRRRRSTSAARPSATTITCSAASRASTASRPATPARPASIS